MSVYEGLWRDVWLVEGCMVGGDNGWQIDIDRLQHCSQTQILNRLCVMFADFRMTDAGAKAKLVV